MPCLFWQSRFLFQVFLAASALSVVSLSKFVDDADPSISYSPSTAWTQGATCGVDCAIQPDASLAHDGTWHYATYDPTEDIVAPSIAFSFTATGIVVRNILPPSVPTALTSRVELAFELDGVAQQSFSYRPSRNNVSYIYDAVVMSATNLSLAEHTLIIQIPPSQAAVVLFDYFELTVTDQGGMEIPQPPSSSQPASSTSLAAPTLTAIVTVTSTQLSPDKIIAASSSTSPSTSPSTPSASQSSGISSHAQPSAFAVSSSDLQLSQDTSSTVTTSAAVPGTLGIAAASSTVRPSQSQPATPMARSITRSATIGGAVGGGALTILCVALCVLRTRCARRRRGIAENEALQRDCAAAADGGVESSEETREQHHSPALIYRYPGHGFSEDPFVHGNEHLGLLPSGTVSSGDITSTGGGATNTLHLLGEAMVASHPLSIPLYGASLQTPSQPQTSLEGWDKDDKSRTAANSPLSHPPALEDTQSFPSLPQAENTQHLGARWSPRPPEENFAEQLATLREEVAQMRRHREAASPLEAPPRYGEL